MKTTSFRTAFFLLLPFVGFLSSCGGGNTEQSQTNPEATKSTVTTPVRPAYDATKIDSKAPVTKISLDAVGNTMSEMHYSDSIIHVKSGSTVKINFHNKSVGDAMEHNFVLVYSGTREAVATAGLKAGLDKNYVEPASADVLVSSKVLKPGEKDEIIFPAPPVGEYEFVCTFPGHWMNMHGRFIIE